MPERLPHFRHKYRICIICEGNEEYLYLSRLKDLGGWNDVYEIDLENACGNGNIPARYQSKYQNGSYEIVLVFCDTDKKPFEQYYDIKRKINEFHDNDKAADAVVIFGNPCTMQVILRHWNQSVLARHSKKLNAPEIEKYTGVADYSGKKKQISMIMEHITKQNYKLMIESLACLSESDSGDIPHSTNFRRFSNSLESDNPSWISEINSLLES